MERSNGVIMHISSLSSDYGIGTLGEEAYKFADFLSDSKIKYWQILPLGQTSYGDSPYQSFSAFAGNPYFIDFDLLREDGLLELSDYAMFDFGNNEEVIDYAKIYKNKYKVLRIAYENGKDDLELKLHEFMLEHIGWLHDYSLYIAIKNKFNNISWESWDAEYKFRNSVALEEISKELEDEINFQVFIQYQFFKQWNNLKNYVNDLNIKIIGDMPIYVAEDSADVWSNPELFKLDENLNLLKQAGCPPDAFSDTGQLWGNPIYDWDTMKQEDYRWWIERISSSLKMYDVLRIDHFRGFESYWEVEGGEKTAINGQWVKGPDYKLFERIKTVLGNVNLIAEDLGVITQEVIDLKRKTGFAGMKVLQFAFGSGATNDHLPHNYNEDLLVYTSTHDSNTVVGWYEKEIADYEKEYFRKYTKFTEKDKVNWEVIRLAWSSTAKIAIAQIQDFLGNGSEARMNRPSTVGGNWTWRIKKGSLTKELATKIRELNDTYGR
ncbi:MAG: 4-alpha-glucanotransferase [Sarcina sp.]